jgi:ribosomal protein L7/L12
MDIFTYTCLFFVLLIAVFSIEAKVKRIELKTKRIENALSLILERMEIEIPSLLSDRVKELASDPNRKIEAIKLYREETKSSLKDAKEAIDAYLNSYSDRHRH